MKEVESFIEPVFVGGNVWIDTFLSSVDAGISTSSSNCITNSHSSAIKGCSGKLTI